MVCELNIVLALISIHNRYILSVQGGECVHCAHGWIVRLGSSLQTIQCLSPLRLRELLTTMGDRLTDEEVDLMLRGAPVDSSGMFDYNAFTRILKHGTKDD